MEFTKQPDETSTDRQPINSTQSLNTWASSLNIPTAKYMWHPHSTAKQLNYKYGVYVDEHTHVHAYVVHREVTTTLQNQLTHD